MAHVSGEIHLIDYACLDLNSHAWVDGMRWHKPQLIYYTSSTILQSSTNSSQSSSSQCERTQSGQLSMDQPHTMLMCCGKNGIKWHKCHDINGCMLW